MDDWVLPSLTKVDGERRHESARWRPPLISSYETDWGQAGILTSLRNIAECHGR